MSYVDGFVLCVPKKSIPAYRKLARLGCKVWLEHGALQYVEAVGEDLGTKFGVSFEKLAKPKKGEVVMFSWIRYRSRAHRDRVNQKVMADPRIVKSCGKKMPFDMQRMSYGGFQALVES